MTSRLLLLPGCIVFCLSACGVLDDTEFNPTYFVECTVDGTAYRAETNQEAYLVFQTQVGSQYEVIGQDQVSDFQINLTLFEELGLGETCVGEEVNGVLTDISLFTEGKTFTAVEHGGSGCVDVTVLTDEEAEGTFEGLVKDLDDATDERLIEDGSFKVRVRTD